MLFSTVITNTTNRVLEGRSLSEIHKQLQLKHKIKSSTACFTLMGLSGGNLKTTLKVKIYDTDL